MKKTSKRKVLPFAAVKAGVALAAALAVLWLTNLARITDRPTIVWRGFYTLLVGTNLTRAGALGRIAEKLGPGVVSEHTAGVTFWSFTGLETVTVDRIDARIDRSDPRRDRVMDSLMGYFRSPREPARSTTGAGGWTVVYLPVRRGAAAEYMRVASLLGLPWRGAWRLQEFDPVEFLLSAAALLAMAVILATPFREGWRERLLPGVLAALLWIPFLLPGGVARLALSLLLLAAWCPAVQGLIELRGWDEKLIRESGDPIAWLLAAAGAGLVLLLPGSGFSAAVALAYAGSIAASVLLAVALALFWGRARRPRRRRKKFEPVPIVKTSKQSRPRAVRPSPGPAVFLLPFAAVVMVAVIGFFRSVPLPTPLPVLGARDFSWGSIERLGSDNRTQRLPDVSDLVTHQAYQETMGFGRPWGLPRPDEMVYVREFSLNARSGAIVPLTRRVKVFDSAWLAAVLRNPPDGSIERLLVRQGRAMIVAVRGQARNVLRELPLALFVLFIFSAGFAGDRRAAPLMKNVLLRFNGAARRNQAP